MIDYNVFCTTYTKCLFYQVGWKDFSLNSSFAFFQQGSRKVWNCICKMILIIKYKGAAIYNIGNVFYNLYLGVVSIYVDQPFGCLARSLFRDCVL